MKATYFLILISFWVNAGTAQPNDHLRISLPIDMVAEAYVTGHSFVHGGARYRVMAFFNPQDEHGVVPCDVYQEGSPASHHLRELSPILDTLMGVILPDLTPVIALEFLGRAASTRPVATRNL